MGNKKSAPRTYLSENDLIFLEVNTKFNREKIIAWHNAFISDCPEGRLDKTHFAKLFKELEPNEKNIEKYAEFVFNAFDEDKSGFIEFTEFLIAFNVRSKGNIEERLSWTFNVYDVDNNGVIDRKELRKMFELLFQLLNVNMKDEKYDLDKRVDDVIKKFDMSGDKKLSRDEFVQGVKSDEPLRKLLLDHEFE